MWAADRVEPDAGWGGIVALVFAAGLFYAVIKLREAFGPWLRAHLRRPSPAGVLEISSTPPPVKGGGRGHLYVVEFSTGTVKVGKTKRPDKRIGEHEREAAAFGGRIADRWVSPAHDGYDANEVTLIAECAREGKQIKREYFSGLPFARAVELAEVAVAGVASSGKGPELTNTVVVGGLLGRVRAVLAAAAAGPPAAAVVAVPAASPAPVEPAPLPAGAAVDVVDVYTGYGPAPLLTVAPGEHGPAIQDVLNHAGLDARVVRYVRGPIASRYELATQPGVSVERVRKVASSLAAACLVDAVSVALVPGRGTVGVDVPNGHRDPVPLADVLAVAGGEPLALGIGASLDGPVVADLARMPHLLIAGASGMGKSTTINDCMLSLIRRSPDVVGLVLVDTKRVELAAYAKVPHLALPVVVEARHAAGALEWLVREVDSRYRRFAAVGVKEIDAFNRTSTERLRYLVLVVDELASLMPAYREDCEQHLVDLAERGRAAGVHMILATQRPTSDVVTGRIKSNVPGRLALTTTDKLESRIIIDRNGAEALRGEGDALLLMPGRALTRVQCAWVSEVEVDAAVAAASGDVDDLAQLREAARLAVEVGYGSTSMLQSRMRLGWPAARRLLGELEARGVVGPADGNKPREVLLSTAQLDQASASWR